MYTHIEPDYAMLFADSMADAVQYILDNRPEWNARQSQIDRGSRATEWDLGIGWSGAVRLAKHGWPQGATDIYEALRVRSSPAVGERKLAYAEAGYVPDVGRYLGRDPRHMITRGKELARKPALELVINAPPSSYVPASCMLNFAKAVSSVVDKLEGEGRQVEIVFTDKANCGFNRSMPVLFGWKVKTAGDPLDLAAMAFGMGHPAALRRIGFALMERTPQRFENSAYGGPTVLTDKDARLMGYEHAVVINANGSAMMACGTMDQAVKFVVNLINEAAHEIILEAE